MPWDIIGHEWATDYLQRSLDANRAAHAYLISGAEGIGKARLALRLAQALNCATGSGVPPCLECRTCRRIERGNYPDVRLASMETQAAAQKAGDTARQRDLKIDTIREWQRDISLRPYEGQRRIFILHDAERLNDEAANAMLKTLEEPPPYATIILVASTANLLPTIVSRCQPLRLRPLPRHQVAQALVDQAALEPDQAHLIAAWSSGRIGWALRIAADPDQIATRQQRLEALLDIQQQPHHRTFQWAEERSKEYRSGEQRTVLEWLDLWQSWWHDLLLVAAGAPESITNLDRHSQLEQAAQRYQLADIYRFVRRISDAGQQLRENVNPQLLFENLFLHLPSQGQG
jgi:DNA polymerase III subunit delta'